MLKFKTTQPEPSPEPSTIEQAIDAGRDEIVVDAKGRVRQAGTITGEGTLVAGMKEKAERSLYYFWKYILALNRENILDPHLHGWFCNFLQRTPPYRKMALMPRGHLKSTCVSECLPMHILLQPREHNVYWPGLDGSEMRILLIGEKQELMSAHLRWIETQFTNNKLVRAFWSHRLWENPKRDAKTWNAIEMQLPRAATNDYADPSIRVIGVGGAITGAHPNVLIKDDLVSIEAANSPVVMQTAIDYHISSRALLAPNEDRGLEFIIGTRWAVRDLYEHIQSTDPTVAVKIRAIIENNEPIWKGKVTHEYVDALRKEYGAMFYLLYMNSAADPELTDFHEKDFRYYQIEGDEIVFEEDSRDLVLLERTQPRQELEAPPPDIRGRVLDDKLLGELHEMRRGWRFRS